MDVAILGSAIDGLLAAHAATQAGCRVVIYGDGETPFHFMTMARRYISKQIPGCPTQFTFANFELTRHNGDPDIDYFLKVVGQEDYEDYIDKYALSEFEDVDKDVHSICDAVKVHEFLQQIYEGHIQYQWITPKWYNKVQLKHDYDIIINTTDITKWCRGEQVQLNHKFPCINFWASTNNPPFVVNVPNSIILESDPEIPHYMRANLFGKTYVEWPEFCRPPGYDNVKLRRMLKSNCDCQQTYGLHAVGAFAKWDHTVRVEDSYFDTVDIIEKYKNNPQQLDLGI